MSAEPDTIAAIATPPGRGGLGVIRISGSMTIHIAEKLLGELPAPRRAHYGALLDALGERLDYGIALFFPAPKSFTGEDVLELHAHGGPVLLDMLMEGALSHGARNARPGEFSERAFLNGKIDLTQAEAIADLIDSESRIAVRNAARSLGGSLSRAVAALEQELTTLRAQLEASLDFDEEDDVPSLMPVAEMRSAIDTLLTHLAHSRNAAECGMAWREAQRVVLCGAPNVGKSSLLNALCGEDAAIVSSTPGTTRDIVRAELQEAGLLLQLVDTAGLRESAQEVERQGMERTRQALKEADQILHVVDSNAPATVPDAFITASAHHCPQYIVENKCDLSEMPAGLLSNDGVEIRIRVSALRGDGVDELRALLAQRGAKQMTTEGAFSARRRHVDCMKRVNTLLQKAKALAQHAIPASEEIAEQLSCAQRQLAEITGGVDDEALLGEIFSRFCIGK